ncbi:MAG: DNA polymerase III subunit delta' [Myxococcales bacterium]|nr:DNA polymerase III subunit delta' [Myxococcales bacterium]|tara:strand:+ start:856 stop:1860 length:1005 start_codon:yes stop_codon:yes gene_type:complete
MRPLDHEFLSAQQAATHQLLHAIQHDRLAHGLLFVGPQGAGKSTLSLYLAQKLLCPQGHESPNLSGCGHCGVCHRVAQKSHPDLNWVLSEKRREAENESRETSSKKTSDLTIADIRSLCQSLLLPPHEGRAKVAVILDAHRMTPQAANALLKTLEEPRPNTHLILVAPSKDSILPTLLSRSQVVRFRPLQSESVANLLEHEGLSAEEALQRSVASDGSIEQARSQTHLSVEETKFLLDLLSGSEAERVLQLASWGQDREALTHLLAGMVDLLAKEVHNPQPTWLPSTQKHLLLSIIEATVEAQNRLRKHGNGQLVVEKLFLNDIPVFSANPRTS